MRKIVVLAIALTLTICTAEAQSILDALKKSATEAADKLSDGKLTKAAIVGVWQYSGPAIRLATDDNDKSIGAILKNAGGTAASTVIENKLAPYVEKIGLKKGFCSITFNDDNSFALPIKSKEVKGTYSYESSDHSLTLTIGTKISVTGHAYISGSELQIVFSAEKFTTFISSIASKVDITTVKSIGSLLEQYKNTQIGLEFAK